MVKNGYTDINERYIIYEFDDEWNVYKSKGYELEFIWSFKTFDEAKKFVDSRH